MFTKKLHKKTTYKSAATGNAAMNYGNAAMRQKLYNFSIEIKNKSGKITTTQVDADAVRTDISFGLN